MTRILTHLELFAGLGGASVALSQAGHSFRTVAISEIDQQALKSYKAVHGLLPRNIGSICSITREDLRNLRKLDLDLVTGGFPCQPFSGLGKMRGTKDPRWETTLCMIDVIEAIKPKYILLENVERMLTQHPNAVASLRAAIEDLGYTSSLHVGNPRDFGYVMSRGRIYIAFSRKDQAKWTLPRNTKGFTNVKQVFTPTPSPDPKTFYAITAKRSPRRYGITDSYFQCLCARSVDAHCRRMTWLPYKGGKARSFTPDELFQLFGYTNPPKITFKRGVLSRSALSHAMGNSWHVGHAAALLKTLPTGAAK